MAEEPMEQKARGSASFKKAMSGAADYAKDPARLLSLVEEASKKAESKKGALAEVWPFLSACVRMLKAYAKGEFTVIPWKVLVLIIASVVYFVMPADAVPDFIPGLGFVDDAALLGWTLNAVKSTVEDFRSWEAVHGRGHEKKK